MSDIKSVEFDNDLLELEGLDRARADWFNYKYEDIGVPRVTKIIEQCQDQSGLINWASRVGFSRREDIQSKALTVGTIVHATIDNYLIDKYHSNLPKVEVDEYYNPSYEEHINNAVNNFIEWDEDAKVIKEIIGLEVPLICPWFGGTADGIVRTVDNSVYIIDFKTSKSISPSYFIQTCAYMWVINNGYVPGLPHVDGVAIIRVDKMKKHCYEVVGINEADDANYIYSYQKAFGAYLDAYYRTINTNHITYDEVLKHD